MLIGYVSDERYVALADVLVEFEAGAIRLRLVRSSPARGLREPCMPTSRRANTASHWPGRVMGRSE